MEDHGLWEASQTEVPSHSQREWPAGSPVPPFVDHDGPLARFAFYYANLWRAVADSLPPKRSALVIGHGGLLEPALVACLAIYDTTSGPRPATWKARALNANGDDWSLDAILRVGRSWQRST